ncbi:MAG TPA: alpha/beta fold hydrolase, partial [Burkholderiaceae bacterium]
MLNGAFGDYLASRNNGLAIEMAFMHRGQALALEREALRAAYPVSDGSLCVFLHGLCCSEASWQFPGGSEFAGQTYGSLLQKEIGITPLFLRYNTGLPIAENGRRLAELLHALLDAFPVAIREIVLIGHSMGGLVARSAAASG